MADKGFKRKLAAILSADAVGYSRLMREDEEATVRNIAAKRVLIFEIIQQNHGRVIDSPGDNILAEFASVVDAVNGAIKIQEVVKKSNIDTPKNRRMAFRIGVNLGDVIEEEKRIYGDGVNIAARVEGLASTGGISISGTVYEHIKDKLSLGYHYLGEQEVKNITEPIRVYRLLTEPDDTGKMISEVRHQRKRKIWAVTGFIALILAVIGVLLVWSFYFHPSSESGSISDVDAFWKKEWLPLPKKPSVVVLPIDNLSNDPNDDYFGDGLTEDLITDLVKISGMFVIARESSLRYKGKSVDVKRVGQELGVRYLLDGSVQKTGNRVRINVQLVDTVSGNHIWTERYDLEQKDLFDIQNQILKKIVTAVDVKLVEGEQAKIYRKATSNPEAYYAFAKALNLFRQFRKEANSLSRQYLTEAIELDPDYADAIGLLGTTHWADARFGWSDDRAKSIEKGKTYAHKALNIDSNSYNGLAALSSLNFLEKKYDRAVELRQQAYSVRPNSASSNALLAFALSLVGREEEALSYMKTAMRLSPFYPSWYLANLCDIFRLMEHYEEAMAVAETIIELNLPHEIESGRLYKSAILIELGRNEEARKLAEEYKKLRPTFTLSWYKKTRIYKDPKVTEKFIGQLRKAGFPD